MKLGVSSFVKAGARTWLTGALPWVELGRSDEDTKEHPIEDDGTTWCAVRIANTP